MQITFHGATREVTGSMHLLATPTEKILLDCGMFQGRRQEAAEKNRRLPVDPATINTVIVSHAHIDHSGRVPMLTRDAFSGRVVCTRATRDALTYLLADSGHIQESDALYLNYKRIRNYLREKSNTSSKNAKRMRKELDRLKSNGHRIDEGAVAELLKKYRLDSVAPLYSAADGETAMDFVDGYPFGQSVPVGADATATFFTAGHILGSAVTMLQFNRNKSRKTICYTGDLGRFDKPILKDPAGVFPPDMAHVDLMIMESTYGDRIHDPVVSLKPRLAEILTETLARGGTVIIPSFAFGRTQELLYVIHELYNENAVTKVPVYVDSPLATRLTRVFGEHPELYDADAHRTFLEKGQNPFAFPQMRFVESVQDSMALNRDQTPHIVISASGMCEAGRILHHLRHKIHDPKHTILIVGFMAQHTLGRRILELGTQWAAEGRTGPGPVVKILGKSYPLRARVENVGGFSAHADRNELLRFLKQSGLTVDRIAVVHGEEDQSLAFADALGQAGYDAFVPSPGESVRLD